MKFGKGGDGGGDFEKPPVGWAVAVLCGVYDLGVRQTPGSTFGPKHQVCLWWELHRKDSHGKPFGLRDVVTASLFEGSHLSSRVEAVLNRGLSEDEREGFDARPIIGQRCRLLLATSAKNPTGNPFVKTCGPLDENDPILVPEADYLSEIPPFVKKIVGDAEAATMLEVVKNGGGDEAVVWRGDGQAQADLPLSKPSAPSDLPEGWQEVYSDEHRRNYYVAPDGSTTWEKPEPPKPAAPPPAPKPAAPPPAKGAPAAQAAQKAPPTPLGGDEAPSGTAPF